jgi:hypothetical protein
LAAKAGPVMNKPPMSAMTTKVGAILSGGIVISGSGQSNERRRLTRAASL